MKANVYFGIAWRIIVLFSIAMIGSYLPDTISKNFPSFFNDHQGTFELEYGWRHIWFNIMIITLFVLSIINFVIMIVKLIMKNYDTTKW